MKTHWLFLQLLEIEQLLQRLSDVNRALADSQSRTDTHGHALARHRSILEEFTRVRHLFPANTL
jgi:hypothetical protein